MSIQNIICFLNIFSDAYVWEYFPCYAKPQFSFMCSHCISRSLGFYNSAHGLCAPALHTKQDSACKNHFHSIKVSSMEGAFLIIWILLIHLLMIMHVSHVLSRAACSDIGKSGKAENRVIFRNYLKVQTRPQVSSIRKAQMFINIGKDVPKNNFSHF